MRITKPILLLSLTILSLSLSLSAHNITKETPKVSFEKVANGKDIFTGRNQYSQLLRNGVFYFCGGLHNFKVLRDCITFDTSSYAFGSVAHMPVALRMHTAVASSDGDYMVVYGGVDADVGRAVGDLWVYHFDSDTWDKGVSGIPLSGHAAVQLPNGKMFVYGGINQDGFSTKTMMLDYSPADSYYRWEEIDTPEHTLPRFCSPAVYSNGYVYQFGGIKSHGGLKGYLNDVVRFKIESNTWENVDIIGSATEKRAGHALALTRNNNLMIIQGYGEIFLDNIITFEFEKTESTDDRAVGKFVNFAPDTDIFPVGRSHISTESTFDGDKTIIYIFSGFDAVYTQQEGFPTDVWKVTIEGH
eukprot:TRINITY_DN405_c0_g1_i1.p1 TRINITY_DN405_c0_g1~~TRINITY_DN405_c0_g1_i1.p1  ORF type:complete len:358 (+),score=81.27 TRINITY_DN405_c0_g1_i1:26-1099(+)